MIKKIHCKCIHIFDNNYTIVPYERIEDNELLKNYIHDCVDYDKNCIFDLRSQIINNNHNGKIYIYISFKRDKDTYMKLHSDLTGKAFISEFEREEKKKKISYYKNTNTFDLNYENNYIYIGNICINFRDLAYETKHCFHTSISKKGKGFYSFDLTINNDIKTNYIDLILSDKPLHSFNSIQKIENIYPSFVDQASHDNQKQNFIQPSAPPMELFNK